MDYMDYEVLANAIIKQAVIDYRVSLLTICDVNEEYMPEQRASARRSKNEIKIFFNSSYYAKLTGVDGEYLKRQIAAEVQSLLTAKEYLQQAEKLKKRINDEKTEAGQIKNLLENTSALIDEKSEKKFMLRYKNAQEIIKQDSTLYNELVAQIIEQCGNMKNAEERILLKYRYLTGYTWRQIAGVMGKSEEKIYRLHRAALKNFEMPAEWIKI